MPRLPRLWSDSDAAFDNNNWGQLLNEYLRVEHGADGVHAIGKSVHGHVQLSAPAVGTGLTDPNVISLAPIHGGGLLVKSPAGVWEYVDFQSQNSIEGDRTNCFLNGTAGQTLAANTFYYVGVKRVGATAVLNFSTAGQTKTADYFVEVFVNDSSTSLVGHVYTLNNSFLFDPLAGRSVVSNWFPTGNQFGIDVPQISLAIPDTDYVKLGTGTLDCHLVTNSSKLFWATALGNASNSPAGPDCFLQLRAINAAGGLNGSGNESAGTSNAANDKVSLSSILGQPFAQGYYRFEVWAKVSAGTGTFVLRTSVLCLSA